MKMDNIKSYLFKFLIAFLIIILGSNYFVYYSNIQRRLNVILITVDSLRSDHLGCYGYKRNTSPNIDRLAKEGVLFTQAIAQSSHTPPSVGTILTATLPRTHLMLNWGDSLNPTLSTIAGILKSKNYRTIFIGPKIFQTALPGFIKDFDIFIQAQANNLEVATNKIIEFFEGAAHKQFFIWVHYMSLHYPYYPPAPYDKLFINDTLYDQRKDLPIVKPVFAHYGVGGILDSLAEEKKGITNPDYYIAQYDGALKKVDEEIGRILNSLKRHKLHKKTIIIITSDHGEMFGEHNYYFSHGGFLYEPLIKVPLIIRCYNVIPPNKIIDIPISAHLDIAPTLLDILKMHNDKKMTGKSLLGIILGKEKYHPDVISDDGELQESVRSGEWKLIYDKVHSIYYLYNLNDDPGELNNLVSLERERFEFLKQKLEKYKQTSLQSNIAKPISDEETKKKLESLGYVQ